MIKKSAYYLPLALTLLVLTAPAGKALAQSTTPPSVVTGTDPVPQYVIKIILAVLHLA